VPALVRPRRGD